MHLAWMDANHRYSPLYDDFQQIRPSSFDGKNYKVTMDMNYRMQGMLVIGYEETSTSSWFLDEEPNDYYDSD